LALGSPSTAPGLSTAYRGNVWRLLVVQALLMFILWVPIWVVFLERKGLSLTQIGLLEAFAWVLTAALEVPTGAIADRWGRKASIAMGALLYSLAMFLILAEALSPAFLIGYALWNTSMAFVSGADAALLYDSLRADGRASEAAKQSGRIAAIQQGSQGVAALLGAALATVDITLCFTICGVTGLAATALVLTIREPPHHDDDGTEPLSYWKNLRAAVAIAARGPVVRALVLLNAMFFVVPLVVYYFLLQPYALGVGLPLVWLGAVVVAIQATTVAASWLAHRVGGRFELPAIVSVSVVLFVVATLVLGAVPTVPSIALMLVVALVPALVGPLLAARLNDLIPSAQRATILSLSALVSELGVAAAVPLLLGIAEVLDPPTAIGFSAIIFAVAVIPLLIVWRIAEPRRKPTAASA
jgi:MFS family permease